MRLQGVEDCCQGGEEGDSEERLALSEGLAVKREQEKDARVARVRRDTAGVMRACAHGDNGRVLATFMGEIGEKLKRMGVAGVGALKSLGSGAQEKGGQHPEPGGWSQHGDR